MRSDFTRGGSHTLRRARDTARAALGKHEPRWILRTVSLVLGLVLTGLGTYHLAPMLDAATSVSEAPVWDSGRHAQPTVYITFDAGNAPDHTVAPLLELLDSESIKATFFLTGKWTVRHPASARMIADHDHLLANHGFNHVWMDRQTHAKQLREVWWTEVTIGLVCGATPTRLYRPPHGGTDADTELFLASHGFRTIMWTKDPSDWRLDGSVTVESIREKIEPIADGDIVCFHLRNIETVDALRVIIPELKAEGFRFAPLGADTLLQPEA